MRGFFRTPFYGEWQIEKKLDLLLSSFSGVLGGCPEGMSSVIQVSRVSAGVRTRLSNISRKQKPSPGFKLGTNIIFFQIQTPKKPQFFYLFAPYPSCFAAGQKKSASPCHCMTVILLCAMALSFVLWICEVFGKENMCIRSSSLGN